VAFLTDSRLVATTSLRKGFFLMENKHSRRASLCLAAILVVAGVGSAGASALAQEGAQGTHAGVPAQPAAGTPAPVAPPTLFPTPEAAMQALAAAAEAKDQTARAKLFGSSSEDLLSGDAIEDAKDLEEFHASVQEAIELRKDDESRYTVLIGKDKFPFALPIVERDGQWLFDMKAGLDELFNRRIGEDELSAIATCRAYALAQWEYFTQGDHDNDSVAEYAQRFISAPGQRNGLYWETAADEPPSPFGKLVTDARDEGYSMGSRGRRPTGAPKGRGLPYHGYRFRILKSQGAHAPGGRYSYVINGNMIAGYALVAYPDKWGASGVMSFVVNQQGRVYQKNLGSDGATIAMAMTEYDPDPSWKLVEP
jgi:Protein of unknown function (DUF2950)